jgi:hypothetical protein
MKGSASITEIRTGTLLYREEGLLALDTGESLAAEREYLWVLEGGGIAILLQKPGAPAAFHDLELARGSGSPWPCRATARHKCGPDLYTGHYLFSSRDRIFILMEISGPAKAQSIHTVLDRVQA